MILHVDFEVWACCASTGGNGLCMRLSRILDHLGNQLFAASSC